MSEDLDQERERVIDAVEIFELAEEIYFGSGHAPLLIEEPEEGDIHYHLECPLCVRNVCCALDLDEEGEVSTVLVALWDEGLPFICDAQEGEPAIVTFWRD